MVTLFKMTIIMSVLVSCWNKITIKRGKLYSRNKEKKYLFCFLGNPINKNQIENV